MVDRKSSLDSDYVSGGLSVYPATKDTRNTLYEVRNNAETFLTQSLSYGGKYIVVDSTTTFPSQGLIRVGTELIYYDKKTDTTFQNLKRGFAGSRQNQWNAGTSITNSVMADAHNAVKDALINIEKNLGLEINPQSNSLNGILSGLETKFLSPKPIFKASPSKGAAPLTVRFQNFSGGDPIRYLWDFGDGATSVELAPEHTYVEEGSYTVKLNMITTLGARGTTTKENYIVVDNEITDGFYYFTPSIGTSGTAFTFVDQTLGDVASRYWIFGDGETESQLDPDIHVTTHVYSPGTYNSSLIVVFVDQKIKHYVSEPIVVS